MLDLVLGIESGFRFGLLAKPEQGDEYDVEVTPEGKNGSSSVEEGFYLLLQPGTQSSSLRTRALITHISLEQNQLHPLTSHQHLISSNPNSSPHHHLPHHQSHPFPPQEVQTSLTRF